MQEEKNAIFQMRFPQKLWYLLNMNTDAILWGRTGRTILLNYRKLHKYLQCDNSIFKTANISSFVRQLNLYGFRKVTSHLQDPLCNSSNPYMHEYIHDYFQYGRPEMLNKITRKALAMRKTLKAKNMYGNADLMFHISPLQKARRNLREALKKAAQDMFMQHSPRQFHDSEEPFYEDEENIELDWIIPNHPNKNSEESQTQTANEDSQDTSEGAVTSKSYDNSPEKSFMNYEEPRQENYNFPIQFLSMPDLDTEPIVDNSGIELLAEFDIEHDVDQGIVRKIGDKKNEQASLNCVLPSISNDPNDDAAMVQKKNDDSDHYHGEWELMFKDVMNSKGSNQECASDLKELYSQISKTIDLLNS